MTNKVICVEFLKRWAVADSVHSSHVNNIFVVSYERLVEVIEQYSSSPSPAPAEGVISTVTNCPTCGSAVKVGGDGETHYYIPITAQSAQGDVDRCVEFWAGKNAILILEKASLEAAIEDIEKLIRGAMVLKTGPVAGDFTEMDIGWNNALNMVLGYMKKKLPTPTTNTREGM